MSFLVFLIIMYKVQKLSQAEEFEFEISTLTKYKHRKAMIMKLA